MENLFRGRLLLVDDDVTAGNHYVEVLSQVGFRVDLVTSLTDMQTRIKAVLYDMVLLDLNLGKDDPLVGLAMILKSAPYSKVYLLASDSTIHAAVDAMKRGATGYFEKTRDLASLVSDLLALQQRSSDQSVIGDGDCCASLIGESKAILEVKDAIVRLKDVDSMVLLLGESGTGKEVIARAIHASSNRAKHRFDAVNCGAIPEALLESELFGHKRGAFTDAKADRKGIFELCSNGTLLLDEIGDMPLSLQMKLLRVLQEWEVTPVGCSTAIKVNTRVIAATHHDLKAEARSKQFREDLYYRLSIVVLHAPPLRERKEDIPLLSEHFLQLLQKRFSRGVQPLSHSVLSRMMAYDWPGNVRELQNALERAVVMSLNGQIHIKDVFAHLDFGTKPTTEAPMVIEADNSDLYSLPLTEAKQEFERNYLKYHLKMSRGQVVDVAEKSGRYRADVYRLLSRYGIDQAQFRA